MKYHLNHIKSMNRVNGKIIVKSTMTRSACGENNSTSDVMSSGDFKHLAKTAEDVCCKHCLSKLANWNEKAKRI